MISTLIILVIFFGIISLIAYFLLYLPTKLLLKENHLKITRLISSAIIGLFFTIFYLFVPIASNNEVAKIERFKNKYRITLTGKRALMVHDPFSLFKRETYLEYDEMIIPRKKGVINGREIFILPGQALRMGTITIDKGKMEVDLYTMNDDKTKETLSWNGEYQLRWVKN